MRQNKIKNRGRKLVDGEKNFWRKKLKRRNQSVSVTEVADQSGIVVHDDD